MKELAFGLSLEEYCFERQKRFKNIVRGRMAKMRNEQTQFEWGTECEKGNCGKVADGTYLGHTA